jgi:hypothetical protein
MVIEAKLIFKATRTHLPTAFPVYYYGTSNNKVYLIYSKLYHNIDQDKIEWVIAYLNDLFFDFEDENLIYQD